MPTSAHFFDDDPFPTYQTLPTLPPFNLGLSLRPPSERLRESFHFLSLSPFSSSIILSTDRSFPPRIVDNCAGSAVFFELIRLLETGPNFRFFQAMSFHSLTVKAFSLRKDPCRELWRCTRHSSAEMVRRRSFPFPLSPSGVFA